MTTLITGATGFVGSAVLRCLLNAAHSVRVLVRSGSFQQNIEGLNIEVVAGDLRAPATLKQAVSGCQALFHVAADYRLWAPNSQEIYASNVTGTRNLMLAAAEAGVGRVVYTSSVATLGINADGSPADEETPATLSDMIGHYKRSKFLAEAEVRGLVCEQGLPVVIVNPSAPIGPRDVKPTPTGRTVLDAARGRMPAYVDTGLNVVHVDDVAQGHLDAFQRGRVGERYILGGENMSLYEILCSVASITGGRPPRLRLPHGLVLPIAYMMEGWARFFGRGEPRATVDGVRMAKKKMFFSSAKAERDLAYTHRPPADAFRDAIDWYRANGYLSP